MNKAKPEVPQFKLTVHSNNHKTGMMPVSTSPMQTCPTTCPFRGNGCYGNYGPMYAWWKKYSNNTNDTATEYRRFLDQVRTEIHPSQAWRHNQAGDLLSVDNETIDSVSAFALADANKGKRGFTYTHYGVVEQKGTSKKAAEKNRRIIETMNRMGFTTNVSCNSLRHAERVIESGIEAPIVVAVDESHGITGEFSIPTPMKRKVEIGRAHV